MAGGTSVSFSRCSLSCRTVLSIGNVTSYFCLLYMTLKVTSSPLVVSGLPPVAAEELDELFTALAASARSV